MSDTLPTKIRNETPCYLELTGAQGRKLILSPLELRPVKEKDLDGFDLSVARDAGWIYESTDPPSEALEKMSGVGCGGAVLLGMVCGGLAAIKEPPFLNAIWREFVWSAGIILYLVAVGITGVTIKKSWHLLMRFLAQATSLIIILAIGLGLPALTIYHFGDGKALLAQSSPALFARLLQVGFIGTASLLPVLLFFLFDRYQLSTMRNRLYRDLFRLDHGLKKRADIDTKYGSQIREAYGPDDQTSGRLARGTRAPVLVCAFVITMGWLAAFKPIGLVDQTLILKPLAPEHTVLAFGFLGAYFFGLQLISRRYARGDLKPKAYGYVTIRIIIVAVLSWALELLYKDDATVLLIAAFLIGIVPEEFFTLIKEHLRGRGPDTLVPESEKHPLTKLEGIDLYDRARLEQEGINNVESLAHYDLIQLVVETQIPVPRLVDWMDQAILYLHVVEEPRTDDKPSTSQTLREYGIRTATDLLACWDAAEKRGELPEFKKLLGGDGKIHRLELIRDALLDDEWLKRVQNWRSDPDPETISIDAFPHTFEGKLSWALHLKGAGRYEEAILELESALKIRDDARARTPLAWLYADAPVGSLRDLNRSREYAKRALELGTDDFDVMDELAAISEKNDDLDDAVVAIDRAIQLIGDPRQDDQKKAALKRLKEKRAALEARKKAPDPGPAPSN